jgi:hypothetical protein
MSRIWSTFSQPYRTSAYYEISVIQIDVLPEHALPLPKRVRTVGVEMSGAPFRPPVVTTMTPTSGPPGTRVRFTGEHLAGRRADVRVTGVSVLSGAVLTEDAFDAELPTELAPGLHQVQVNVSGLFRRIFLFEVS